MSPAYANVVPVVNLWFHLYEVGPFFSKYFFNLSLWSINLLKSKVIFILINNETHNPVLVTYLYLNELKTARKSKKQNSVKYCIKFRITTNQMEITIYLGSSH